MNRKHTVSTVDAEQQNGQFAVKRNRKADIIAALVCVLIALLVWLVLMSGTESDYVELVVGNSDADYKYELSVTQVEIEGSVTDLRDVTEIRIMLPEDVRMKPGKYYFDSSVLKIPDGVALSQSLNLTVTITEAE